MGQLAAAGIYKMRLRHLACLRVGVSHRLGALGGQVFDQGLLLLCHHQQQSAVALNVFFTCFSVCGLKAEMKLPLRAEQTSAQAAGHPSGGMAPPAEAKGSVVPFPS